MKTLLFKLIYLTTLMMGLGPNLLFADEFERSWTLMHGNDISITGKTTGATTGDDLLTGILELSYKDIGSYYVARLNIYTQRHTADGKRVDSLEIGYYEELSNIKQEKREYKFYFGGTLEYAGNLLGESLQNGIHYITSNQQYYIDYSSKNHVTAGVYLKGLATYKFNHSFQIDSSIDTNINIDLSGYVKLKSGFSYQYDSFTFKISEVFMALEPLNHHVIKASTPDRSSLYTIIDMTYHHNNSWNISLSTTLQDTPLGQNDDYYSQIKFEYALDIK